MRIERAALVGNSLGAQVALDFTLEHPDRVPALVLVGPPPLETARSLELQEFGAREDALLDEGKVDEAVELNLRTWLATADTALRRRVGEMQRRAFEVQLAAYEHEPEPGPVEWLDDPPAWKRLSDVSAPTLVVIGDRDVSDVLAAAELLSAGIPEARKEVIEEAAHVPGLERPEEFNRIVLEFLGSV